MHIPFLDFTETHMKHYLINDFIFFFNFYFARGKVQYKQSNPNLKGMYHQSYVDHEWNLSPNNVDSE